MNPPTITVDMTFTSCWTCGVSFALPRDLVNCKRKDGRPVYCPNGHRGYFICEGDKAAPDLKAENKRLQRAIIQAKHRAEQAEARAAERRAGEELSLSEPEISESLKEPAEGGEGADDE